MYEKLMGLPLFKGVTRDRIDRTVGSCRFHFLKYPPETTIFSAGDPCTGIAFVLSGAVRIRIAGADGRFTVTQTIEGYDVISPDFLFGRRTCYPGDVISVDTVSILQISKNDYIRILNSDPVFLFNYLNLLSMNSQKAVEGVLAVSAGDMAERIAYWVSALTQPRSRDIVLECQRCDLSSLFGVPRSILHTTLEDMKEKGYIDYNPDAIFVKSRPALLTLLHDHAEPSEE